MTVCFFFKKFSPLLRNLYSVYFTSAIVKYLFKLVKGTVLQLVPEHAVHNFFAINL